MLLLLDNKYSQWVLEHSTFNGGVNVVMGLVLLLHGVHHLRHLNREDAQMPGLSTRMRRFIGLSFVVCGLWACVFGVSLIGAGREG